MSKEEFSQWKMVTEEGGDPVWAAYSKDENILVEIIPIAYRIKATCFSDESSVEMPDVHERFGESVLYGEAILEHAEHVFKSVGNDE